MGVWWNALTHSTTSHRKGEMILSGERQMHKEIFYQRRGFLRTMGLTIAAAHLGMFGYMKAFASTTEATSTTATRLPTNASFGTLKQIDAGVLSVGYAESGPANGPAVL